MNHFHMKATAVCFDSSEQPRHFHRNQKDHSEHREFREHQNSLTAKNHLALQRCFHTPTSATKQHNSLEIRKPKSQWENDHFMDFFVCHHIRPCFCRVCKGVIPFPGRLMGGEGVCEDEMRVMWAVWTTTVYAKRDIWMMWALWRCVRCNKNSRILKISA